MKKRYKVSLLCVLLLAGLGSLVFVFTLWHERFVHTNQQDSSIGEVDYDKMQSGEVTKLGLGIVNQILDAGNFATLTTYLENSPKAYILNQKSLINDFAVIRAISKQLKKHDAEGHTLQDYLFKIILASKQSKKLAFATLNAMTILNAAQVSFRDKDLSGIHASVADDGKRLGPNLGGGCFAYTRFCNADLRGAIFEDACLVGADFSGVALEGASFTSSFHGARKPNHINSMCYAPDGKTLACGTNDGSVQIWDVVTGKCLKKLKGHTNRVTRVHYAPDSKTIVSGSRDKTIKVWDMENGTCLQTLKRDFSGGLCVCYAEDGRNIAFTSKNVVKIWNLCGGKCLRTLQGHEDSVNSVCYAPDGKILASGGDDKFVKVWDSAKGTCLRTLKGHKKSVNSVAFAPDGKTIASASVDTWVKVWHVASGKCLRTLKGHKKEVNSVVFSPDGKMLASAGDDNLVKIWDTNTGRCLHTFYEHVEGANSVAFAPDGKTLSAGGMHNAVKIWSVATGKVCCLMQASKFLNLQAAIFRGATGLDEGLFTSRGGLVKNPRKIFRMDKPGHLRLFINHWALPIVLLMICALGSVVTRK